ncbi:unnamed protein product, partial [Bubo scandiacus]
FLFLPFCTFLQAFKDNRCCQPRSLHPCPGGLLSGREEPGALLMHLLLLEEPDPGPWRILS